MFRNLTIVLILLSLYCTAQNSFEKYYDLYFYSQLSKCLSDSSFIILGQQGGIAMLHLDKYGVTQNTKSFSPQDTSIETHYIQFTQTSDGNFVAGFTDLNRTSTIFKIDSSGNILWTKSYYNFLLENTISETSDHGFILCGRADTIHNGIIYDKIFLKTDSIGNTNWSSFIPNNILGWEANYVMAQTADGGYLFQSDFRSIKFDNSGNILRAFDLSNYGVSSYPKLIQVNPNKYLLSGYEFRCVDSTGAIIWEKYSQISAGGGLDVFRINDSTVQTLLPFFHVWQNFMTNQIDINGNVLSSITYPIDATIFPRCFGPTFNHGLFICGEIDPYQIHYYDLVTLRTDSDQNSTCGSYQTGDSLISMSNVYHISYPVSLPGNVDTLAPVQMNVINFPYVNQEVICSNITEVKENDIAKFDIRVAPNPFHETFTVLLPSPVKSAEITLINVFGGEIYRTKVYNSSEVQITPAVPAGLYYLRIHADQFLSLIKIVRE